MVLNVSKITVFFSLLHEASSLSDVYHYVAVLREVEAGRISGEDVVGSMIDISRVAEEQMGGTSGALYSCVPSHANKLL